MEPNLKPAQWLYLPIFFSLACCPLTYAAPCSTGQLKTPDTLAEIERAWASALEQRNPEALGCLLAEEFQDTDPEGTTFDRTQTLSRAANHRPVHHELHDLSAHVYGDFGYIRGLATAADQQGKIIARVRFTDIYIYRDQRWQAVAAHESLIPEKPKTP
jgi:hypothetical protein